MYKCIIVDDEKPARDEVQYFLEKDPMFEVIATFNSGRNLLESIDKFEADKIIFFLDIDMPGINGITLSNKLKEISADYLIIFTTAYEEYAVTAFELNALDYLLKPIENKRMSKCLDRIRELENKEEDNNAKVKLDYISLEKNGKIYPIKIDDISFIKASNRGVLIETIRGSFTSNINLCEIKEKLDDKFYKCHRSYVINVVNIDSIEPWFNRTYQIKMKGSNEEIPVSRNYINDFKRIMSII